MLLLSPFALNLIEDNNYDGKSKNFVHKRQAREFDLLKIKVNRKMVSKII